MINKPKIYASILICFQVVCLFVILYIHFYQSTQFTKCFIIFNFFVVLNLILFIILSFSKLIKNNKYFMISKFIALLSTLSLMEIYLFMIFNKYN